MFGTKKELPKIKRWEWIILAVILLLWAVMKLYSFYWPKATVEIGGQQLKVLVADTVAHQYRGLSGRADLGEYGGMLFVFRARTQHSMVMRDMMFPLDLVWIDGGTIVDIAPAVSPEPGKSETELTPYFARQSSTAVLELPSGFAQKYGLKIGDKIKILEY